MDTMYYYHNYGSQMLLCRLSDGSYASDVGRIIEFLQWNKLAYMRVGYRPYLSGHGYETSTLSR